MSLCDRPLALTLTEADRVTGEVRTRDVQRRCGSRLTEECLSCSELYAGDARQMIRSGTDGPGPLTWLTVTAPGNDVFGAIHIASTKDRPRRCPCKHYHRPDARLIGTPVDPTTYRYDEAVGFNARVGRLFTVLIQKLRRLTGEPLQVARVIEFQRRGLAHVHALIQGTVPIEILRLAINGGTNPATNRPIAATTSGGHRFGPECDAQPVVHAGKLSSYILKLIRYATKGVNAEVHALTRHGHQMGERAARTVKCDNVRQVCNDGFYDHRWMGRRGAWTCRRHRAARRGWGFRGHVLAASRGWGETFTTIRARRSAYQAAHSTSRWMTLSVTVQPGARVPAPEGRQRDARQGGPP